MEVDRMADESFETVDSLELRINASAKDAADKIESLSTSVANFGAKVSSYIKDVSAFADAIGRISTALGNMSGLKNLRSVIGSAASAAGKMKDKTFQKQFNPAIPPVRAANSVTGRTRVVNWQGQGMRRFNRTSDEIARDMNRGLNGTGMSDKDLSARVSAVREMIIRNDENAVAEVKKLADSLAGGAGGKNVSSLIQALNDVVGNHDIGVDEKDIKGFGESLANVNQLLKDAGAKFRFAKWANKGTQERTSMIGADDLEHMGIASAEDLYEKVRANFYNYNKHTAELNKQGVRSDDELSARIFGSMMDDVYASEEVVKPVVDKVKEEVASVSSATGELDMLRERAIPDKTETQERIEALTGIDRVATSAKESAEAFKQLQSEEDAAWKSFNSWNKEQDKYYKEDYGGKSKTAQMDLDWKMYEAQNAAGMQDIDNTEAEIAAWKSLGDEIDAATEKKKEFFEVSSDAQDSGAGPNLGQHHKTFEDFLREQGKTDSEIAAELGEDWVARKYIREAEGDSGAGPHFQPIKRFEDYNGPDLRAENARKTEEFDARFSEILSKPNALKNIHEGIRQLGALGPGNTREYFAKLRERWLADKASESGTGAQDSAIAENAAATASSIQEAKDAQQDLGESTRVTAEQFMNENTQADILKMKLEGVGEELEEALNSEDYDPAKISRLADQYQKLSDKIRETGAAAKETKGNTITLRGVLDAVGKTLEKSILGQLARVARMRALRAVVKGIASAFKEGIGNMYQWSKGIGGSFAGAMDTLASKTMLAKNSVAAAFAPAIQAIIPLVSTVVSWINAASNALAQFFALLNGQTTWTRATESVEEWAAATKKGTGGAGKAVKDLLADWDELNIIQSESGGGGGGGGSKAPDYKSMFEEVDMFDDWTKDFETIKDIVIAIGAGIAAWFAVDTIQDFLTKLGIAGGKVDKIFTKIKQGIVGAVLLKVGFELAENAGEDIAENGLTWENALKGIGALIAGGLGGYFVGSAIGIGGPIGTILGLTITVAVGLNAYIDKKRQISYAGMAREAFGSTGTGGFNVEAFKKRVEKEFNKRMGHLSLSLETFESYGTAKKNLEEARKALDDLSEYINGSKALTKEQAEEFKANWETIYEALAQMHNATWETINLGIADAMAAELDESEEYLRELQKNLIEAARLTGGAQAAYEEEMRQINGRIVSGKATEEDWDRYEVLQEVVGESDVSKSLGKMQEWSDTLKGFDFGNGEEAIENATKFVQEMGSVYSDAKKEVKDWQKTQKEAIEAASKELESYNKLGYFEGREEEYDRAKKALEDYSEVVKDTAESNMDEIERVQNETYDRVFNQILMGAVKNTANGGSIDQYLDEVQPILDELEKAGFEIPEKFERITYDGIQDFKELVTHLLGNEVNGEWYANELIPLLKERLGEEGWSEFSKTLPVTGKELMDAALVGIEPYEIKATAKPEDAFKFDGFTAETAEVVADQVELSGGYIDEDTEDWSLADMESSGGGVGGTAPWFSGPSEESFEMDASGSGLATDDKVGEVGTAVGAGFGQLESLMNTASTILRSIETYSRITANKDFTVNVNASTGLGRVAARSAMRLAGVTGEGP
jgi:hypothetical protein